MKILFTVENYYPKMSGVPNVVKYLAEGLAARGNQVTIVTRAIDGCKEEEVLNSVRIIRKNIYYTKLKGFSGDVKEYIDFVVNFECDVIILECSQCITTDLLLPYLNKITDKKKIFHSHGFSGLTLSPFKICSNLKHTIGNTYNWIRWNIYYNYIFKKYVKDFDITLSLSKMDSSNEYLQKYSNNHHILPNAANDMFFDNNINVNKINNYTNLKNDKYFISIANYQDIKNQIEILKEYYKSKVNNYDMVFIGSEKNEYYEMLIKEYNRLKSFNKEKEVHFLIGVDREDIPSILKGSSLYIAASKIEAFSISIVEAMAMGIPFISTDVGNARELEGGITVKNCKDISSHIDKLMENVGLYNDLIKNGTESSRLLYRIEIVIDKLLNIIG